LSIGHFFKREQKQVVRIPEGVCAIVIKERKGVRIPEGGCAIVRKVVPSMVLRMARCILASAARERKYHRVKGALRLLMRRYG